MEVLAISDIVETVLTILENRWFNSLLSITFIIILMLILELRSERYRDLIPFSRHVQGKFHSAYTPSRNYLDVLLKFQSADPIKLTIYLSKEIKKILKLQLTMSHLQLTNNVTRTTRQNSLSIDNVIKQQRNQVTWQNLDKIIEALDDPELKLFFQHPIQWTMKYLKPPSKLGLISYFKRKHLIENAEHYFTIFEKIQKYFGFQESKDREWSDDLKKSSLQALKKKYWTMLLEDASRTIGFSLFIGIVIGILLVFGILSFVLSPLLTITFTLLIVLYFLAFTLIKIFNASRVKRLKELAETEDQMRQRMETHEEIDSKSIKDEDLIQLRYY